MCPIHIMEGHQGFENVLDILEDACDGLLVSFPSEQ